MIIDLRTGRPITHLPHESDYNAHMRRLPVSAYNEIVAELNRRIDGNDVHTSSWIPGRDWTGTVFEPIFHACGRSVQQAGMFFGQILWRVMQDRPEEWASQKADSDELGIAGTVYFRVNLPRGSSL